MKKSLISMACVAAVSVMASTAMAAPGDKLGLMELDGDIAITEQDGSLIMGPDHKFVTVGNIVEATQKDVKDQFDAQKKLNQSYAGTMREHTAEIDKLQNDVKNNYLNAMDEIAQNKVGAQEALKEAVKDQAKKNQSYAGTMREHTEQIGGLNEKIDSSLDYALGQLDQAKADQAQTDLLQREDINNLKTQQIEQDKRIDANKDAIRKAEMEANKHYQENKNAIAKEQADRIVADQKLQGAIDENKQAIADEADARAEGDKLLQENIDAEVANRKAADDALSDRINANAGAIAQNSKDIASHYAEMKNNFAAVNQRIDNLDDEMNKGFAAQAALSGLFQPYNVGKFNLTGGFGTYESEVGIALGMGYRVNENFAVKAGVATNTSDFDAVTTNASFNIEW